MANMNASTVKKAQPHRIQRSLSYIKWEHLAGGISGGILSTLILHPLDLIKIRFQVNEGQHASLNRPQYNGVADAFRKIRQSEGIHGLYRGVTPNIWGTAASWGFYFLFYNAGKTWMQEYFDVPTLGPGHNMIAAAQAGILTLSLTNPVWVAKTRLCLQYENATGNMVEFSKKYNGMSDCLMKIYKYEGIRGLYKGYLPGLLGVSHGALQFMAYEELKKNYNIWQQVSFDTKFNSLEYLTFAAISKIFAASVTYPYQVVRSRLQDQHRSYYGVCDVILQTWRLEGVLGFYKGLAASLLRVTPACCITFVVYEKVTAYISTHKKTV